MFINGLEMPNAYMIEQNGGPGTDTVKSNDKDESLEMPNADTDTVNSSDKDEKLEMSNAYMGWNSIFLFHWRLFFTICRRCGT
jgi:hypothetical protein